MNKNLVVTIVVVLIIIAAAGGYFFMNRSQTAPVATQTQEASMAPTSTTEKASLKDFMSMGGSQKCLFNDPETQTNGEVYISEGKMRGDFNAKVGDKLVPSHMVNDGKDIYIWMDDQTTGFKTSLQAIEEMSQHEGMTGVNQSVDLNKQVDYSCEGWIRDETKFAVPVEVKFQDMGAMMQSMKGAASMAPSASIPAAACAACDNLQGSQRDQCRTALKCN